MKHIFIPVFCLLALCLQAQQKTTEFTIGAGNSISDYDVTETGNLFILENGKGADKTRLTVLDADFRNLYSFRSKERISGDDLLTGSQTWENFLFQYGGMMRDKNIYRIYRDTLCLFSGKNDDGTENTSRFRIRSHRNANKLWFSNDSYFVYLLEENKKMSVYIESLSGTENYSVPLNYKGVHPALLHVSEEDFVLAFPESSGDTSRAYRCMTFDYRGQMRHDVKLVMEVEHPDREKFAVLRLNPHSFSAYPPAGGNGHGGRFSDHRIPTEHAKGAVVYDAAEQAYYCYAGVRPESGDSGFLIGKYDDSGKQLWQQYKTIKGIDFGYANSANRHLTIDITPYFIGISAFSTRGKSYCNFYITDKRDGSIINSRNFKNYRLQVNRNRYAGFYARFGSSDAGYDHIVFDRFVVYASLYSPDFSSFRSGVRKNTLLQCYPVPDGVNLINIRPGADTFTLHKFVFRAIQ